MDASLGNLKKGIDQFKYNETNLSSIIKTIGNMIFIRVRLLNFVLVGAETKLTFPQGQAVDRQWSMRIKII